MTRLAASLIAAALASGCAASGASTAPEGSTLAALASSVTVAEASALRDDGALVLDVREPDEWAAGRIPDATLIPLGELASRVGELERNQRIIVVCRSGNRSAEGRDILLAAGYPAVTSLDGGMTDWAAAGMPVVTGG